ncbi:DUF2341 domain-containing protein [Candidatus Nomurabacteria bacterium]|nr:DUF2341 domain-containing protein [Candidatus Nomurabacteria bacterium]
MRIFSQKTTNAQSNKTRFKALKSKTWSFVSDSKTLITLGLISLIVVIFTTVRAETLSEQYDIQTINVFPEQVTAKGWKNFASITQQQLDEDALYQEFSNKNSAYLPGVTKAQSERTDTTNTEAAAKVESTETNPTNYLEDTTSEETGLPQEEDNAPEAAKPAEQAPEPDTSNEEAPSVEAAPEAEPTTAETAFSKPRGAFAYAFDIFTHWLPFAVGEDVDSITVENEVAVETESSEPAPSPDEEEIPAEIESEELPAVTTAVEEEETTLPIIDEEEIVSTGSSTDPVNPDDAALVDETAPTTSSTTEAVDLDEEDTLANYIMLSGFGVPLFDEESTLGGAQLRLSFAAKQAKVSTEVNALIIEYSFDGTLWNTVGDISVVDEASNSINGGYYLFSLPEIKNPEQLTNLSIRLQVEGDAASYEGVFIDSAWLEVYSVSNLVIDPTSVLDSFKDGYTDTPLTGDTLTLDSGQQIDFDFSDENKDETLIIKSDNATYGGLSKATVYFNVTNESSKPDDFSLKTYFPSGVGSVVSLDEWNQNKAKQVVIPEYRPFVYHCEGGWDLYDETAATVEETPTKAEPKETTEFVPTEETASDNTPVKEDAQTEPDTHEQSSAADELEVLEETPVEESPEETVPTTAPEPEPVDGTSEFEEVDASAEPLVALIETTENNDEEVLAAAPDGEVSLTQYQCLKTQVVRTCDALEGDGTACLLTDVKVAEHHLESFDGGWEDRELSSGDTAETKSLTKRITDLLGFGPDIKEVPAEFEVRTHTPDAYSILPGETRYFKMEIEFPPHSAGEFWIEAVGDSEYGLLDPYWSSAWTYRMPITLDNTGNSEALTEQQVLLRFDSSLTDFWSNVSSDGSDIRFVNQLTDGTSGDWYSSHWNSRTAITIDATMVSSTLTNFPVYVDLSDLGSDFWSKVATSGADIRVTTGDGRTELPHDLVSIHTSTQSGELHFLADTVDGSVDTTFYIYYNNPSASAYSVSDTYGRNAVWNQYEAVYHFENNPTVAVPDASGHGKDLAPSGTGQATTTGQVGAALDLTGTASGIMLDPDWSWTSTEDLITTGWYYQTAASNEAVWEFGVGSTFISFMPWYTGSTGYHRFGRTSGSDFTTNTTAGWHHFMTVGRAANGASIDAYIDTVLMDSITQNVPDPTNGPLQIGRYTTSGSYNGYIDELRLATTTFGTDWMGTEYNNQNSPSTFYATSSSPDLSIASFSELDFWVQYFDSTAQEADIWVQVDAIPAAATSTIYVYYGASGATSASDEWATFTYSTPQPVYRVVDDSGSDDISIVSLIDDNEVSIDGSSTTTLDIGESVVFSTFDGDSVISALGPISGTVTNNSNNDGADTIVPISFATTTFAIPTNRGAERWYVNAPFASTSISTYIGSAGTPTQTLSAATGTTATFTGTNPSGTNGVVIEATNPVLVMQRSSDSTADDGIVAYPPTLEDIYGFYSNSLYLSATANNPNPTAYCSSGSSGIETGITRGELQAASSTLCTNGAQMTGNAVRFSGQVQPLSAIQQADADGNESTVFWAEREFGTFYAMTNDAQYAAVICSPRFGTSTIEVRDQTDTMVASGTCAPSGNSPGRLHFGDSGTNNNITYTAGHTVVSTNGVPFYLVYEDVSIHSDEKNVVGSVQARKFANNISSTFGAEEYSQNPEYEQLSYGWYESTSSSTPTAFWPLGDGATAAEGVAITGGGAVNDGDTLRLRLNVAASVATTTAGGELFSLEYATATDCSLSTNVWSPLGEIGSTTAAFTGFDQSGLSDNASLSSTTLASSTAAQSYEEENYTEFNPTTMVPGDVGEWDWSIYVNSTETNTNYCFRMVRADGGAFQTYTGYPELETAGPPLAPNLSVYFDNEATADTVPILEFSAVDSSGDDIEYQVQIDDDRAFGSPAIDKSSITFFNSFSNLSIGSDKAPFNSGDPIRFTGATTLATGTTYYWRVRGNDPSGSNTWGDWSEVDSFTVDSGVTVSEWRQTTGHQFGKNALSGLATTTGGVQLSGASGDMTSGAIDFDDGTAGNAWGAFSWSDTETAGAISYQIEYQNGSSWDLIPDTEIAGNSTGLTSSPVSLLGLDTDIYNVIRLKASFTGSTLSIEDWSVLWGQRVDIPTLDDPFDNEKVATTTPTFTFVSSDPQGDDLEYELSWSTDITFTSSTTRNSNSDGGFSNTQDGGDSDPFTSGEVVSYPLPSGDALTNGVTYWWRVRAKDPVPGGDAWSPWSEPDSFTVDTGVTVSTWFQTSKEQFEQGTLDGLTASTSGSVVVSNEVGEYGTVTLTNNTWTTVNTNLEYNNMVVVASPEYAVAAAGDNRNPRVRNKTANSFEIKVDDYTDAFTGTTQVDYVVMEAGTWTIDDGSSGVPVFAGTEEDVSDVQVNTYSDTRGSVVSLPGGHFSSAPIALATISSNNDSTWVATHVDNGVSRSTSVTSTGFRVSMARSMDATSSHSPEDIDYILFGAGTGSNNSVHFQTLNTSASVVDSFGASGYNQALSGFSSTPAVTVVNNNAESGGNGGFALKDLSGTNNASQVFLSIIEGGSGANGHTGAEVVSVLAFENSSGIITRLDPGSLTGTLTSEEIYFTDGTGPKFDEFSWNDNEPGSSDITYQLEYYNGFVWQAIPNVDLSGNTAGFTSGPVDLSGLNVSTYDTLRISSTFSCVSGNCPSLDDWSVTWAEGVSMSGTLEASDRSTPVASGTVRVAVNGTLQPSTGTVSAGVWTINNVTAFEGDAVTVFVDGATDDAEAVTVFVYDGTGDMTGVELFEQYLSVSADETATTTNALIASYDYSVSGDEDLFFDVDGNNDLTLCAVGSCADNSLYIGAGNVYVPDASGSGNVTVHDIVNDGYIDSDSNTIRVSGSWQNNSTFVSTASPVIFTATSTSETIDDAGGLLSFGSLTFGEGSGTATWKTFDAVDVNGDLFVTYGTFDRSSSSITVARHLTTGASGYWSGTGTTTFDGTANAQWTDNNAVKQNIGDVVVNGSVKNVVITTDVEAYDVTIGADDTLSGGGTHTISVGGDWTNNHTFSPQTSHVIFVPDDRTYAPGDPGSTDWYSDTDFVSRQAVTIQASQIDSDLTNFPVYLDLSTLGSGFWSNVNTDGGDIRMTTGDGQTEVPIDLVAINTGTETGELHFLAPSLSSATNTTFYVYYNNNSAAGYSDSDPYGAYSVWTEYQAVYHFEADPTVEVPDASGNGKDLTPGGTGQSTTTGALGSALSLVGTATGVMYDTDWSWTSGDDLTSSGWYYQSAASNEALWAWGTTNSPDRIEFRPWYSGDNGLHYFGVTSGATYTFARVTSWHHFTTQGFAASGASNTIYEDGILRDTVTQTVAGTANSGNLQIGRQGTTGSYEGYIDELRFTMASRTEAWIDAEYVSQKTPTTFYATSSVETYDPGDSSASASHIIKTNGSSFYQLTFNDPDTDIYFTEANLTVLSDLTIATGTITLPSGITSVGGSFLNTGGTFLHNNATLQMTGSGSEVVTLLGTSLYNQLYNVTFSGSGDWTFTDSNATTSGSMVISNGDVTFPDTTLVIRGGLNVTGGGAFDANSALVRFLPNADQTIRTNGSSFNDVIFGSLAASFGWYDTSWLSRKGITVDSANISSSLTNFPVYVDLSTLGSSFWSEVRTDGGDIRITTSDGQTEVPYELVSFDPVAMTGELHFLAPSISNVSDTIFYIYHNNSTASGYAASDPYGAYAVWSEYEAVYHFEDDPSVGAVDASGHGKDLAANGTGQATTTGTMGSALDLTGTASGYLDDSDWAWSGGDNIVSSGWYYQTTSNTEGVYQWGTGATPNRISFMPWYSGSAAYFYFGRTYSYSFSHSAGWHHFFNMGEVTSGLNMYMFEDGVANGVINQTVNNPSNTGPLEVGRYTTAGSYNGYIDELRFATTTRPSAWVNAEYINQGSPTTFYATSSGFGAVDSLTLTDVSVDVIGDVSIGSVQVIGPSGNFTIAGSFLAQGLYEAGTGAVIFDSNDTGETVAAGGNVFYDLSFNNPSGGWTVTENIDAANNLDLLAANDFTASSSATVSVGGNFTNDIASVTTWTGSTLRLYGNDHTVHDKSSTGDVYDTVVVEQDADIVMWNTTIASSSVLDTGSLYLPDYGGSNGLLYIYGDYDGRGATEYWSYATDFDGTDLSASSSERAVSVYIASSSALTLPYGFNLVGDGGASTTIEAIDGAFDLTTFGSTITAQYFAFSGLGSNGWQLGGSTTTVTDIADGTFAIGTSSSAMTVAADVIDNNPAQQFFRLGFVASGTSPINVTLSGLASSYWWMRNGSGDTYGELYDNDDGDPGAIQWDDSQHSITVTGVVYADDGSTPLGAPTCDGLSPVVTVVIDGSSTTSAACSPEDGSYTVRDVSYEGDPKVTVYLDHDAYAADPSAVTLQDQDSGSGTVVSGGTVIVDRPSVSNGDILVAVFGKDDDLAIDPPAGWTEADTLGLPNNNQQFTGLWYKPVVDVTAEPTAYAFTSADTDTESYSYWIGSFSGVDLGDPFDVTPTWTTQLNTQTPAATSITTVTNGSLVIAAWYVDNDTDVTMPGGSWTTQTEDIVNGGNSLSIATRLMATAGVTGNASLSAIDATSDDTNSGQFALKRASYGGGTTSAAVVTRTPIINVVDTTPADVSLRFSSTGIGSVNAASTFIVDRPGTAQDDFLVLIIGKDDEFDISAPAGWTPGPEGVTPSGSGSTIYSRLWYRTVDDVSTEPTSYTFTSNDTSTENYSYWMGSFDGVDLRDPFDVEGSWTNHANDASPSAPSITTTVHNALAIAVWYMDGDSNINMPGGAWTTVAEDIVSGGNDLSVASRLMTTAGATGDSEITAGGTGSESHSMQFALKPDSPDTNTIGGLDLYGDRVIVRHEDDTPLTIADMTLFDATDDSDIPFVASVGAPDTLTVLAGNELYVWDGMTFAPDGDTTLLGNSTPSAYDGSLHLAPTASFEAAAGETLTIGGNYRAESGALFSPSTSLVLFNATTTGHFISASSTQNLYDVTFNGSGGEWTNAATLSVAHDVTVTDGTLTGSGNISISGGSMAGDGVVAMTGGTVTLQQTNTFGGNTPWTFASLTFGNGSLVGTTTRASTATTTVTSVLRTQSGHTLLLGSGGWNLRGNGTVVVNNGSISYDTSTVRYSGSGTVYPMNYYNLDLNAELSPQTVILGSTGINIVHNLSIGGATTTTVNANTLDPLVAVGGDMTVRANGTYIESSSNTLQLSGSYDNDGGFTVSGGLVEFVSSDAYSIAPGSASFGRVTLSGSGTGTLTENATSTGAWTLATSSNFVAQSGTTLAVGGAFTNNTGDSGTTWTGSTLSLFGGGFTVNPKGVGDSYDTVHIVSGTSAKFWDSTYSSVVTETGGGLYSMDHGGSDGLLHIYGDYMQASDSDHWSYLTDFDGADISGSPRVADVQFASGASATYTGGTLSVKGTTTATTTITNQGSGTYGLTVGGTASTTWQYVSIRNIDSTGLSFTGTPTVTTLGFTDLSADLNGASSMTVAGSVIDQNPAKNFTNNIFRLGGGVSGASNVTVSGISVSSWRFTNHSGGFDGEGNDNDSGDPGEIVWDDSAAVINISGHVYSDEGSTASGVGICNGVTQNVHLRVAGLTSYTTSCAVGTGAYSISGISFSPNDTLTVYIDNGVGSGATVSVDPISNISNMDIYEQRVIVRHENISAINIEDMAVWDSSDDGDIPFTAVDAGTDSLTLPADHKLIVWTNKSFDPGGDVTISGGGGGSSYDGALQLYNGATLTMSSSDTLSVGASFTANAGASFEAANSTVEFTSDQSGETIDVNNDSFYDIDFIGSGDWSVTDSSLTAHDLSIASGDLTLPTGTTTLSGSLNNTGGNFDASASPMIFTATSGGNVVRLGGSDLATTTFAGTGGAWTMPDTNATSTGNVTISAGSLTLPSGIYAVGGNFSNAGTVTYNNNTLDLYRATGATSLQFGGSDLGSVVVSGGSDVTVLDTSATLRGSLTLGTGTFTSAVGTLSVGGSFDATAGTFAHASGTVLFNSSGAGKNIYPGGNDFYNLVVSGTGSWTMQTDATTTNNFTLSAATAYVQQSGTTMYVGGVFTNNLGGSATTWTGSTLYLDGANAYSVNSKSLGSDQYNILSIGANSDIRLWNSSALTTTVDGSSSLYSQRHAGVNGSLFIFGDFHISTTTEYWSYATDFDGTSITPRAVTVQIAGGATTTVDGGTLNIVGGSGNATLITNQGSGTYTLGVTSGTLNANYYQFRNLDANGLDLSGTPTISNLSNGDFELAVSGGSLITLATETLNANASKIFTGMRFATTTAITGINVNLAATSSNAWRFTGHTGNLAGEDFDIDGTDDCGSIRWEDSACLLIEQTHYRWRLDDGGEGAPDSDWYDNGWTKRASVRLRNNDNTTYATTSVLVTVPYDADMQADFDDLRFTDSSGTPVSYWTERVNAGSDAEVWVSVPSLPASAYTTLYMYYGSSTVDTASDGDAVMNFIDDFEDGSLSEYSGDTGLFTVGTSFNYGGNYGLDTSGHESDRATDGVFQTGNLVAQGEVIRYRQYVDATAGAADEVCTLFGVQTPGTNNNNYGICFELYGTDRVSLVKNVIDTESSGTILASSTLTYTTGWYDVRVDWQTDDTISITVYDPTDSVAATLSVSDSSYTTGGMGFTYWGMNGGWDSYISYPRVTTDPTVYLGAEQTAGGASWAAAIDTPASAYQVGDVARLRFAVENSGLDITGQQFQLEAAPKGASPSCEAVGSGSYSAVPVLASCGSSAICMATSSTVTNNQTTTDHLSDVNGTFTTGRIVANTANKSTSIDTLQNEYTELEYVLTPTVNVADEAYCLRVTNDGTELDSYTSVAELSLQFSPTFGAVTLNGGNDIDLAIGATTTIYATATVTDLNGYADLITATSTIYRSGAGAACTADNNSCYISTAPQCSFSACAGSSCTLSCAADIYYFADPTDSGSTYDGQEWLAYLEVVDGSGNIAFGSAPGVEMLTLRALDVENSISYGSLAVNDDTGSYNATTTLVNLGNDDLDVQIVGSDLSDGSGSTIDASQQRFATSTFDYSSCVYCTNLATTSTNYEVDLGKPTAVTPPVEDEVYWGIAIPFGTASNPHTGNNTFYAIGD